MDGQDLRDRLDRAKAWIDAASRMDSAGSHEPFIFYYIAFNALYGRRQYEGTRTQGCEDRRRFLENLKLLNDIDCRHGRGILAKALARCRDEAAFLITDIFTNDDYCGHVRHAEEVQLYSRKKLSYVEASIKRGDFFEYLNALLKHLTVLRNQIMHGCVTYGPKSKGADSLRAGTKVLKEVVPAFHELMSKYGQNGKWGAVPYPRLGSEKHPEIGKVQ